MNTLEDIRADGVNTVADPDILGGTVVFKGSRFPVRILLVNLEDGMSVAAEMGSGDKYRQLVKNCRLTPA